MTESPTLLLDARTPSKLRRSIDVAAALLQSGGLVAFPTETVYGLGASARDTAAIARIFEAKGRPADNPLIVHVDSLQTMEECGVLDDRARTLAAAFMPGPLTVVVPAREIVPPIARAGLPTVALRIPDHPIARALAHAVGPLVAPSANTSGRPSATDAQHVMDDLQGTIDAVIDGGPCSVGIESTVVDLSGEDIVILRPGVISAQQISAALGGARVIGNDELAATRRARSPGTRYRHYAPAAPVIVVDPDQLPLGCGPRRLYLVADVGVRELITDSTLVFRLTEAELYRCLRRADAESCDEIVVVARLAELPPGLADRLMRSAGQR